VTRVSTYDRPQCLPPLAGEGPGASPSLPTCVWKEYTAKDGTKYYSDGKTSLWEEPAELK
jgi:hypothetical protein